MTKRFLGAMLLLLSCVATHASARAADAATPTRLVVGDVELHYVERGQGEPLILLHGGQGDYRWWQAHVPALSSRYRVISYSRRYHHPNANPLRPGYSPLVDAEDLAGLIRALGLERVHLVGASIGAFGALALAVRHPELVRTLVLAEPPLLGWATRSEVAAPLYRDFMARTHDAAAPAFAVGDDEGALRAYIDAFDGPGTYAALPAERRTSILQNVGYFRAITASPDPYPDLPREAVAKVDVPVLVVRGERTNRLNVYTTDELLRTLPHARLVVIPGAGHGSSRQKPAEFTQLVVDFLEAPLARPTRSDRGAPSPSR